MRDFTRSLSIAVSMFVVGMPALVFAQAATPPTATPAPARETPRPQDIDPGVNTSATPPSDPAPPSAPVAAGSSTAPSAAPARAAKSPQTRGAVTPPAGTAAAKPVVGADGKPLATNDGKPKGKSLDRLELDTTQITGNRELPKVLYIVPWKRADLGDLVGKPVNSLLDEVLTPVDRDVFKRENRYYRALAPAEGQPGANGAPPSGTVPNGATSGGSATPAAKDEK